MGLPEAPGARGRMGQLTLVGHLQLRRRRAGAAVWAPTGLEGSSHRGRRASGHYRVAGAPLTMGHREDFAPGSLAGVLPVRHPRVQTQTAVMGGAGPVSQRLAAVRGTVQGFFLSLVS